MSNKEIEELFKSLEGYSLQDEDRKLLNCLESDNYITRWQGYDGYLFFIEIKPNIRIYFNDYL